MDHSTIEHIRELYRFAERFNASLPSLPELHAIKDEVDALAGRCRLIRLIVDDARTRSDLDLVSLMVAIEQVTLSRVRAIREQLTPHVRTAYAVLETSWDDPDVSAA